MMMAKKETSVTSEREHADTESLVRKQSNVRNATIKP